MASESKITTFSVDPDLAHRFRIQAVREGRRLYEVTAEALEDYLAKCRAKAKRKPKRKATRGA